MRKSVLSMGMALILAMAFTSCKKTEEGKSENAVFRASTVSVTSSDKTYVGQQGLDTIVMWNAGDAIKVFTRTASPFSVEASVLTTDENAKSVVPFYGNVRESDVYYAFYPACNITDLEAGNKIHVTLPETQAYTEGGFAVNTFPMWAFSTEKYFNFRSTCAILGIQLNGNANVGSIVLSSKSEDQPLAGTVEIDAAAFDPSLPRYTFTEEKKSVTLNCGEQGVQLDENKDSIFYFVIPANTYHGIEVVVNDMQGNKLGEKETLNNLPMAAETIYYMATFTVNADEPTPGVEGQFTVNAQGHKVVFAPGNLYYYPDSTYKWQFAKRQYGTLPSDPQMTDSPSVNRDIFGWGTSGYDNTADDVFAKYFHPWDVYGDYDYGVNDLGQGTPGHGYNVYGYGPSDDGRHYPNIDGTQYDWGVHNAIYNPKTKQPDFAGTWRVLTGGPGGEWEYIIEKRNHQTNLNPEDARFAKACLTIGNSSINGLIIFPDNYEHPDGAISITCINDGTANYSVNTISSDKWEMMDSAGAVFLPEGARWHYTDNRPPVYTSWTAYWSATHYCEPNNEAAAYMMYVDNTSFNSCMPGPRAHGLHVRLVKDVK